MSISLSAKENWTDHAMLQDDSSHCYCPAYCWSKPAGFHGILTIIYYYYHNLPLTLSHLGGGSTQPLSCFLDPQHNCDEKSGMAVQQVLWCLISVFLLLACFKHLSRDVQYTLFVWEELWVSGTLSLDTTSMLHLHPHACVFTWLRYYILHVVSMLGWFTEDLRLLF